MHRYRIVPPRSRVWIDARSNVHPIHTEADGLEGWVELDIDDGTVNVDQTPRGHLEYPVENLKSGNALEDRELRRRIDTRRYPTITGELKYLIPDPGDLSKMTDTGTSASGIAADDQGNIYAADVGLNNLRKYVKAQ